MTSVDNIVMERYVRNRRTRKDEFYIRMHCHSGDFVCRVIAVAAVKINKMADCGFPR